MAPKKKSNKKNNEDWEDDLGEAADPTSTTTHQVKADEDTNGVDVADEATGGGGLLAALKKNKNKKSKKNRPTEDYIDGEDLPDVNGGASGEPKEPEEANLDEDDVFAGNSVKNSNKGKQQIAKIAVENEQDEEAEGGKVKSKKEKEKEKKEREKQRKKEQVRTRPLRRAADKKI